MNMLVWGRRLLILLVLLAIGLGIAYNLVIHLAYEGYQSDKLELACHEIASGLGESILGHRYDRWNQKCIVFRPTNWQGKDCSTLLPYVPIDDPNAYPQGVENYVTWLQVQNNRLNALYNVMSCLKGYHEYPINVELERDLLRLDTLSEAERCRVKVEKGREWSYGVIGWRYDEAQDECFEVYEDADFWAGKNCSALMPGIEVTDLAVGQAMIHSADLCERGAFEQPVVGF